MATTDSGSSGSPILREYHNKWAVVGLHRGTKADASINIATCMTAIVDDVQGIPYTGEGMTVHRSKELVKATCTSVIPLTSCSVVIMNFNV